MAVSIMKSRDSSSNSCFSLMVPMPSGRIDTIGGEVEGEQDVYKLAELERVDVSHGWRVAPRGADGFPGTVAGILVVHQKQWPWSSWKKV